MVYECLDNSASEIGLVVGFMKKWIVQLFVGFDFDGLYSKDIFHWIW